MRTTPPHSKLVRLEEDILEIWKGTLESSWAILRTSLLRP